MIANLRQFIYNLLTSLHYRIILTLEKWATKYEDESFLTRIANSLNDENDTLGESWRSQA